MTHAHSPEAAPEMPETLYVKPAVKGAVIRDPARGTPLPKSGAEVPRTAAWLALLARKDIKECDRPAEPAPAPEAAPVAPPELAAPPPEPAAQPERTAPTPPEPADGPPKRSRP